MKKLKKISLEKKEVTKLGKDEMSEILGKGYYSSSGLYFGSSVNTSFTMRSCRNDGDCYGANC